MLNPHNGCSLPKWSSVLSVLFPTKGLLFSSIDSYIRAYHDWELTTLSKHHKVSSLVLGTTILFLVCLFPVFLEYLLTPQNSSYFSAKMGKSVKARLVLWVGMREAAIDDPHHSAVMLSLGGKKKLCFARQASTRREFSARLAVQKQSSLFSWDSTWPPGDKGPFAVLESNVPTSFEKNECKINCRSFSFLLVGNLATTGNIAVFVHFKNIGNCRKN